MKRIIYVFLVIILVMAMTIIPVSAAKSNRNLGEVKKVSDSDIDMSNAEMNELAWQYALKIHISRPNGDAPEPGKETSGDVYLLWSDTAYYAFFEISDPTPVSDPSKAANAVPWEADSVEFFIDETNEGEHCEQFRVDRDGVPSYYPKAGAWPDAMLIGKEGDQISDNETMPNSYMTWKVKTDGNKYYVKMKVTFFSNVKAGEIGMHFQINDLLDDFSGKQYWPEAPNEATSWDANLYDYVVLVEESAVPEMVEIIDTPVAQAIDTTPVQQETPSAPQTGNNMILLLTVLSISGVGTVVIAQKKRFKK